MNNYDYGLYPKKKTITTMGCKSDEIRDDANLKD